MTRLAFMLAVACLLSPYLSGCAAQVPTLDRTDETAVKIAAEQIPPGRVLLVTLRGERLTVEGVSLRPDSVVYFDLTGRHRRSALPTEEVRAIEWAGRPSPVVYAGAALVGLGALMFSGVGGGDDASGGELAGRAGGGATLVAGGLVLTLIGAASSPSHEVVLRR